MGGNKNKSKNSRQGSKVEDGNANLPPGVKIDKTIELKSNTPGRKFLIMKRKHVTETMRDVSPFLIQKVIQNLCGEVINVSMMSNKNLLIETIDVKQANLLIQLTQMDDNKQVEVQEDVKKNSSKGVIIAPELLCESDEVILEHLTSQQVVEIYRVKRKEANGNVKETGTFFVTFDKPDLPNNIKAGYMNYNVRPYIPTPTQCYGCGRFGHIAKFCKASNKTCLNCSSPNHFETKESKCQHESECVNCKGRHHALNKRLCNEYKKQCKIQEIRVTEKTTFKEAEQRFRSRSSLAHRLDNARAYSEALSSVVSNDDERASSSASSSPSSEHENEMLLTQSSIKRPHARSEDESENNGKKNRVNSASPHGRQIESNNVSTA